MAAPEQWWVVLNLESHMAPTGYVIQSASKPAAKTGQIVEGPYPTRAAAEAALHGPVGPNPPPLPHLKLPNPLAWLGGIAHWTGDLVLHLTDVAMWRSIGWILLGGLLLWWGILLWLRVPQRVIAASARAARAA